MDLQTRKPDFSKLQIWPNVTLDWIIEDQRNNITEV